MRNVIFQEEREHDGIADAPLTGKVRDEAASDFRLWADEFDPNQKRERHSDDDGPPAKKQKYLWEN